MNSARYSRVRIKPQFAHSLTQRAGLPSSRTGPSHTAVVGSDSQCRLPYSTLSLGPARPWVSYIPQPFGSFGFKPTTQVENSGSNSLALGQRRSSCRPSKFGSGSRCGEVFHETALGECLATPKSPPGILPLPCCSDDQVASALWTARCIEMPGIDSVRF